MDAGGSEPSSPKIQANPPGRTTLARKPLAQKACTLHDPENPFAPHSMDDAAPTTGAVSPFSLKAKRAIKRRKLADMHPDTALAGLFDSNASSPSTKPQNRLPPEHKTPMPPPPPKAALKQQAKGSKDKYVPRPPSDKHKHPSTNPPSAERSSHKTHRPASNMALPSDYSRDGEALKPSARKPPRHPGQSHQRRAQERSVRGVSPCKESNDHPSYKHRALARREDADRPSYKHPALPRRADADQRKMKSYAKDRRVPQSGAAGGTDLRGNEPATSADKPVVTDKGQKYKEVPPPPPLPRQASGSQASALPPPPPLPSTATGVHGQQPPSADQSGRAMLKRKAPASTSGSLPAVMSVGTSVEDGSEEPAAKRMKIDAAAALLAAAMTSDKG